MELTQEQKIAALSGIVLVLVVIVAVLLLKKRKDPEGELVMPENAVLADISIPIPAAEMEVPVVADDDTSSSSNQPPIIVVTQPPSPTNISPTYP